MMTSQLRKRLMEQMNAEPEVRQWVMLSKCGAGLAIVALIAFIGSSADERRDEIAQVRGTVQAASAQELHRREVFERRRATFEQSGRGQLARQLPARNARPVTVE